MEHNSVFYIDENSQESYIKDSSINIPDYSGTVSLPELLKKDTVANRLKF